MSSYYPPQYKEYSFHCPTCGVYSDQKWFGAYFANAGFYEIEHIKFCRCTHCKSFSVWSDEKMIQPYTGNAPLVNTDLPDDIGEDYNEAKTIMNQSPRGAAALLRLAIQKLCMHLGTDGKNINSDISKLVAQGLPVKIQQALDYVRVVGNNAVHPGVIDLKDNIDVVNNLFILINLITDVMISQPKHVESLYQSLPTSQLDAIQKRDTPPAD